MATGISLHIGVNKCDGAHYSGWEGPLNFCEADANSIHEIAKSQGFESRMLLTQQAKRNDVIESIEAAAAILRCGDIFLLSYAGHGGQIPDKNRDERDRVDETWCLFDGQLLDDEIDVLMGKFLPGVRVLVLSDSCHSGSVTRNLVNEVPTTLIDKDNFSTGQKASHLSFRFMPRKIAISVYAANSDFYDERQSLIPREKPFVAASVLLISGCKDNQLSGEAWGHGLFTAALLDTWENGDFEGGHGDFYHQILKQMPSNQTPMLFPTGISNEAFYNQKPFSI